MLKNDLHDINSIDHQFLKEMILVDCSSIYFLYDKSIKINKKITEHELYSFAQQFKRNNDKETILEVLIFTSHIALNYNVEFKDMVFGGKEIDILKRGTDWCADMSRVGCVLLQCLGIPARIVHIVNLSKAYNGHVVVEAFYENCYGICDFVYDVLAYKDKPLSALELNNDRNLVTHCYQRDYKDYSLECDFEGLYSAVGINEYDPLSNNNYLLSKANEYYINIIYSNHHNSWIMGEDKKIM